MAGLGTARKELQLTIFLRAEDRRPSLALWLVMVTTVVLLLGPGAVPATAHARLTRAAPAAGSTVTIVPTQVRLIFSEAVLATAPVVKVTGPDGTAVDAGHVAIVDNIATVALDALKSPGTYLVAWRVVSDDGHPIHGGFYFTVTAKAISQAPPTESAGPSPVGLVSNHQSWIERHGLIVVLGVLLLAVGCLLIWAERRRAA